MLTPLQRKLRATIAAHAMHAQNDSRAVNEKARAIARTKLDQQLIEKIDPNNSLPAAERERRLDHARRAHYAAMAYKRMKKAAR